MRSTPKGVARRLSISGDTIDYDVLTSSLEDFLVEARRAGVADRVRPVARGETLPI